MTLRRALVIAAVAALSLVVAACAETADTTTTGGAVDTTATTEPPGTTEAPDTTEPSETTTTTPEVVTVDYATSFGTFGRDAYVYVAEEKGYFDEAGFDVTITPGQGSVNNARFVASGQLDYSPIDFSAAVLVRANEDLPVRCVSFVHQFGLSAIFTKESSDIDAPADLPGHTIADIPGSVVIELFPIYAERVGFDPDGVEFVNAEPPQLPGLLASDQVDAVNQFVVGEPLFANVTGGPVTVFPYSEVFPEFPGICIAVSEDKLAEDPNEIMRFISALNRGLQDAIDDPQEAGEILNSFLPEADAAVAAAELEIMGDFVTNDYTDTNGIGTIDSQRVSESIAIISDAFDLPVDLTVDDLYAEGFAGN